MFWRKKKKKRTRDETLAKLIDLLFPAYGVETLPDGTKIHIDYSVDFNLDAAVTDLQLGRNDEVVRNTISNVIERLIEARTILDAFHEVDEDIKHIIVDTPPKRTIVAADENLL